jgi:chorismate synthase
MRYVTAGESHGPAVLAVIEGVPAGLRLEQADIDAHLSRRQVGYGRGGRMAIESDTAEVLSGVRHGHTLGTPLAMVVRNRDWENWQDEMAAFGESTGNAVTAPRPGHADLAGVQKSGATDVRDVLERASARETAARAAAGAVARALLRELGVEVASYVCAIGDVSISEPSDPATFDHGEVERSDVRCPDPEAAERMRAAIDAAKEQGESLGGLFYVIVHGLVPGVGEYAEAPSRLDARLAAAVCSIPAIKGVEFGAGFSAAGLPGSQVHDEIIIDAEGEYRRSTNRAGGLEGGMTNGEPLVLRGAMKPIPTLMKPLATVDIDSGDAADAAKERSDVCAVPAAAVVAEAEVALTIAAAYCEKFGSDALDDMRAALGAYRERIRP